MSSSFRLPELEAAFRSPYMVLVEVKTAHAKSEATYHRMLHRSLALSFAAFRAAWDTEEKRKDLLAHWKSSDFFKRPVISRSELLRKVVTFTFEHSHGYNRQSKYARALELLDLEDVAPEDVEARLVEEGGIDALYERAKQVLPYDKKTEAEKQRIRDSFVAKLQSEKERDDIEHISARDEDGEEDEDVVIDAGDEDDDGSSGISRGSSDARRSDKALKTKEVEQRAPSTSSAGSSPERRTVNLEVSEECFDFFMGMQKGRRCRLTVACRGRNSEEWQRLEVTEFSLKQPKSDKGDTRKTDSDSRTNASF